MDPLEVVALDGPEKLSYASTLLSSKEKEQLRHVLVGNVDIFSWSHSYMVGIDPTLASDKLNVIATEKSMRQKISAFLPKSLQDYSSISGQPAECRFYQRGEVSQMARKCSSRPEEGR